MKTSTLLTPNHYVGRAGNKVTLIGIHTMEAPEAGDTAENVAHYFMNPAVEASAHWCVDDNSRVRCVEDVNSAWTMPPTNLYSLNVEMAGYAAQNKRQWDDKYSLATMDNAAVCCAEWIKKYDLRNVHLTSEGIRDKHRGMAGHIDVNNVFHGSTHTDPGTSFPWDHFIAVVKKHLDPSGPTDPIIKPPTHQLPKPDCKALQSAVHATADNQWGPDTDKNCAALIAATPFGGSKFPYGIEFAQKVVGAKQDGAWGPDSKSQLRLTVVHVQRVLLEMKFNPGAADGVWGTNTNKAYTAARSACHI